MENPAKMDDLGVYPHFGKPPSVVYMTRDVKRACLVFPVESQCQFWIPAPLTWGFPTAVFVRLFWMPIGISQAQTSWNKSRAVIRQRHFLRPNMIDYRLLINNDQLIQSLWGSSYMLQYFIQNPILGLYPGSFSGCTLGIGAAFSSPWTTICKRRRVLRRSTLPKCSFPGEATSINYQAKKLGMAQNISKPLKSMGEINLQPPHPYIHQLSPAG